MQLAPFTVNFISLVVGVMLGAYIPLALLYLISFFRRERLGLILIWRAAVRLAVIVILLFFIFMALGIFIASLPEEATEALGEEKAPYLGSGLVGGFLVGVILFVIGLMRGRRRVAGGTAT